LVPPLINSEVSTKHLYKYFVKKGKVVLLVGDSFCLLCNRLAYPSGVLIDLGYVLLDLGDAVSVLGGIRIRRANLLDGVVLR